MGASVPGGDGEVLLWLVALVASDARRSEGERGGGVSRIDGGQTGQENGEWMGSQKQKPKAKAQSQTKQALCIWQCRCWHEIIEVEVIWK